jgi:hypothetical protein
LATHFLNDPKTIAEYLNLYLRQWPNLDDEALDRIGKELERWRDWQKEAEISITPITKTGNSNSQPETCQTQAEDPNSSDQKASEPGSGVVRNDEDSPQTELAKLEKIAVKRYIMEEWMKVVGPDTKPTVELLEKFRATHPMPELIAKFRHNFPKKIDYPAYEDSFANMEQAIYQAAADKLKGRGSMLQNIRGLTDETRETGSSEVGYRALEASSFKSANKVEQIAAVKAENQSKQKKKETIIMKAPVPGKYDENGRPLLKDKEVSRAIAKPKKKSPPSLLQNMLKTKMYRMIEQCPNGEQHINQSSEDIGDLGGKISQHKETARRHTHFPFKVNASHFTQALLKLNREAGMPKDVETAIRQAVAAARTAGISEGCMGMMSRAMKAAQTHPEATHHFEVFDEECYAFDNCFFGDGPYTDYLNEHKCAIAQDEEAAQMIALNPHVFKDGSFTEEWLDINLKAGISEDVGRMLSRAMKVSQGMEATQTTGENNHFSDIHDEVKAFWNEYYESKLSSSTDCFDQDNYAVKGGDEKVSPEGVVDLERPPSDGLGNKEDPIDYQQQTFHPFPEQLLPNSAEQLSLPAPAGMETWTEKKVEACYKDLEQYWGQFDSPT